MLETKSTAGITPRQRRFFRPAWLIGILGVIALGWTGFWLYAARETGQVLQAWMAREKAFGRTWSCPSPKIGGYPFAITIACAAPRFDGLIFGQSYSGTLQDLRATALLAHPRDVHLSVAPPFVGASKDGKVDFELSWSVLDVDLKGLPQDLWQLAVTGQNLVLHSGRSPVAFTAGANDVAVTAAQRTAGDGADVDFNIALAGAVLPFVTQMLGAGPPIDVTARATVTKAGFDTRLTPAQNLDRWRTAGGRVRLGKLLATRGATEFAAHGTFTLNAAHQVDGQFETTSSGLEPVMKHYGIDPGLLSFGALLGNLLSGHKGTQQPSTALHLPVTIRNGRFAVGPIRTSLQLPPVY